jgi:hypothetical protein
VAVLGKLALAARFPRSGGREGTVRGTVSPDQGRSARTKGPAVAPEVVAAITLDLNDQEALVLFEFVSRFNNAGRAAIEDQAEQRVLWDIEAMLEGHLTAVLARDYLAQLAAARDAVRDPDG